MIALEHYDVDVYAGGEEIPEGELWVKRNCIRITRKATSLHTVTNPVPFFLFSENCSEKEDFYHALLHNQERRPDRATDSPTAQSFDTEDMIKLIRQLHTTEETSQTRWLNALVGRIFLALYKTSDVHDLVRTKIEKKVARVPKPAFITSLRLVEIVMGDCGPMFSNPKLREMTVDGGLTVEVDLKYSGRFKLVIAAVARIELGSRFKSREVDLILASIINKLEGHLLLRIKPPPSNRVWLAFETMPRLEMSVEPVVSSRQITYGVILRAIESRIREVFSETIVVPNWDDIPFTHTEDQRCRGGIWRDSKVAQQLSRSHQAVELVDLVTDPGPTSTDAIALTEPTVNTSLTSTSTPSSPSRSTANGPGLGPNKESPPTSPQVRPASAEKPRMMRANSFALAASPVVTPGIASMDLGVPSTSRNNQLDAASSMKTLSGKRLDIIEAPPPAKPPRPSTATSATSSSCPHRQSSTPSLDDAHQPAVVLESTSAAPSLNFQSSALTTGSIGSTTIKRQSSSNFPIQPPSATPTGSGHTRAPSKSSLLEKSKVTLPQSLNSASILAKSWGWSMLNRAAENTPSPSTSTMTRSRLTSEPIGRGQPLPPIGSPLPMPKAASESWAAAAAALGSLRRKPVANTGIFQGDGNGSAESVLSASGGNEETGSEDDHGELNESGKGLRRSIETPESLNEL